tara:strand:- start:5825 stop:6868 length:1044 start_codon:yes stop_codon:yes gene_type:complete
MSTEIKSPTYPESVEDGVIAKWVVKEGEQAKQDEVIAEIETDKVVIEVVAPNDGTLKKILKDEGQVVLSGELIAEFDSGEINVKKSEKKEDSLKTTKAKKKVDSNSKKTKIERTSKNLREEKRVPMSRIRKTVAERLVNVQQETAMLTTFNEVNMAPIQEIREKEGDKFLKENDIKLGFMGFFVMASIKALDKFPQINASIDDQDIVYHGYKDIGVAVSTERGLVVPIIRDADILSLGDIEKEISEYAIKAHAGKLSIESMQGGTFTISNGGVFGSLLSTPILNAPQTAILGMHKIEKRAVVENDKIVIKPMMYLALSYDHRMIDGKEAVSFLVEIKEILENPKQLL